MNTKRIGFALAVGITAVLVLGALGYIGAPMLMNAGTDEPEDSVGASPNGEIADRRAAGETDRGDTLRSGGADDVDADTPPEGPTAQRYVNRYSLESRPQWHPERSFSPRDTPDAGSNTYEVTRYPRDEPTPEDLAAAWQLYNRTYDAAAERGWFDFDRAIEDGFKMNDFMHYANERYYLEDNTLDPTRPESLIYYRRPNGSARDGPDARSGDRILAGVMYFAQNLSAEGEQVAGPLTVWHFHTREEADCFAGWLAQGIAFDDVTCPDDAPKRYRSGEMIHVWFVRNPEGPFASRMSIPRENVREPDKMSRGTFENHTMAAFDRYGTAEPGDADP